MKPSIKDPPNHNIGLPQGFIKFGTLAHQILVMIHKDRSGWTSFTKVVEAHIYEASVEHVATILQRLAKYEYIYDWGRYGVREGVSTRPQTKWGLTPRIYKRKYQRLSGSERCARYRDKNRGKVDPVRSVFDIGARAWPCNQKSKRSGTENLGS